MLRETGKKIYIAGIAGILLVSFFLRIYDLNNNPPGFFADEAAIGYNAYKILQTGKDGYGIPLPIFFRSFGDYRLPLPIYLNIPTIFFLGLKEEAVRLTAIIFSLISILFISLTITKIWNKTAGLVGGLILAILPWHIHLSRWGSEYIYFPALLSIGFYYLVSGFKKSSHLIIAFIFFSLAMYTYYPSLFITPLFVFGSLILWIIRKKLKKLKYLILSIFLFFILCFPLYLGYKNGSLMTRWYSVNNPKITLKEKIVDFKKFYLSHFSLDFLFLKGDLGMPGHFITRHSVENIGELYAFQLPLIIIGIIMSLMNLSNFGIVLMIWLLFLYPIGSAITSDGILATRSIIGIIPLTFFSALGLERIIRFIKGVSIRIIRIILYLIITTVILFSFIHYGLLFYREYPKYSADFWGWQYGPREIISYFKIQTKNYDELYMTGYFNAPEIFLKFYDPERKCRNCFIGGVDKYNSNKKQLFAIRVEELEDVKSNYKIKNIIYYPNREKAFYIIELSS